MPPLGESTSGRSDCQLLDLIALHPGAEVALRHVVFFGAGAHAIAAADALVDVDNHGPPVLGDVVVGGRFRFAGQHVLPGDGCRGGHQNILAGIRKHFSTGHFHGYFSLAIFGLWGW